MAYKENEILELASFMASSPNGVTLEQIMDKFGYKRRTAERKRDKVIAKFPTKEIYVMADRKKRWKVTKNWELNQLLNSYNKDDIATLQLIKEEIKSNNKGQFVEFIDELIDKINYNSDKKDYNDKDIEYMLDAEGWVVRQRPHYEYDKNLLYSIRYALQSMQKIEFDYNKKDELTKRTVHPYGVLHGRDKIYLIGFTETEDCNEPNIEGVRTYSLSNISNLKVLEKNWYDVIDGFDFKEYVNQSFGIYHDEMMDIKLKFTGSAADSAKEYFFHPTQKITEDGDDLIVEFTACGKMEICWELFKWRTSVQILEPQELKDYYKNMLENVLKEIK